MTKILTRKCSIPDKNGDIKESVCDFNILMSIQMDIETYSYFEVVFKDFKSGKILQEIEQSRNKKKIGNS
jgi:hypothetical protein